MNARQSREIQILDLKQESLLPVQRQFASCELTNSSIQNRCCPSLAWESAAKYVVSRLRKYKAKDLFPETTERLSVLGLENRKGVPPMVGEGSFPLRSTLPVHVKYLMKALHLLPRVRQSVEIEAQLIAISKAVSESAELSYRGLSAPLKGTFTRRTLSISFRSPKAVTLDDNLHSCAIFKKNIVAYGTGGEMALLSFPRANLFAEYIESNAELKTQLETKFFEHSQGSKEHFACWTASVHPAKIEENLSDMLANLHMNKPTYYYIGASNVHLLMLGLDLNYKDLVNNQVVKVLDQKRGVGTNLLFR